MRLTDFSALRQALKLTAMVVLTSLALGLATAASAQGTGNVCQRTPGGALASIGTTGESFAVSGGVEFRNWFQFAPVAGVRKYTLTIVEYSVASIPPNIGRTFSIDLDNLPTRFDPFQLHYDANLGLIRRLNLTSTGATAIPGSIERLAALYGGIVGRAEIRCDDAKPDVGVAGRATITEANWDQGRLYATYRVTVSNNGGSDAASITLGARFPAPGSRIEQVSSDRCLIGSARLTLNCQWSALGAGQTIDFDIVVRIVNATDFDAIQRSEGAILFPGQPAGVELEVKAAEDADANNNVALVKVNIPFRQGSYADTRAAMEAMRPYFDYAGATRFQACNSYRIDIQTALDRIRRDHPTVFTNLSYGAITSGTYSIVGVDAGHVGVVVYLKGTDYRTSGIIIHGTPVPSPLNLVSDIGNGGALTAPLAATSLSGLYLRTPADQFGAFTNPPRAEAEGDEGFEGRYADNASEFPAPSGPSFSPTGGCPALPNAVALRTDSPVEIIAVNSRGQRVETRDGRIVAQELDADIFSMAFQHADGTYGWVMLLPQDDYDLQLVGSGSGPYTFTMTTFDGDSKPTDIVSSASTTPGQIDRYRLVAPSSSAFPPPGGGSVGASDLLLLLAVIALGWALRSGSRSARSQRET